MTNNHTLAGTEQALRASELRYRRLFEAAKDGILILDVATGRITDVNPFLTHLLGFTHDEMLGKTVGELSPFRDIESNQVMLEHLQEHGYIRYEDLPLKTRNGQHIAVEFVSNVYDAGDHKVIQCNVRDITARKKSEEQLKLFRSLMEQSPDAIEVIDPATGRFLDFNQTAHERLGYTRAEMLCLSLPDIVAAGTGPISVPHAAQEVQKAGVRIVQSIHRRKDGSTFPVEINVQHIHLDRDYMVAVVRDITERKAAEWALHESETRYRSLFANMLEGYAYCRLLFEQGRAVDFVYLEVNAAFEHLSGLSNVVGKKISELVPGLLEENPEILELYARVALTGEAERLELYLRSMGIWLSLSAYSDSHEYFSVFFENITERKRNESRFHRLVESNAQGVIFWNNQGKVSVANDAYLQLVGYTREDLEAGRVNWIAMTPSEYADLDRRALDQIAATGVSEPYEKEYIRKDGSRVPILLGAAAFEDNPNEGVCFFIDLTDRKKLEHQFLRAQRMESIGTLAGGIAHDLNNILAPILMSIEILKLTATDSQANSVLETIEVSAKRGADIVRQVLSFARGMEGERVEVQPKHLLQDVETIIKDTFPKNIQLRFSIPNDIWTILGDSTQIHQVLLNLCVNARDAMPNGGSLSIRAENCVLDENYAAMNLLAKVGRYVNINITDTGTGIPANLLDKIFEPFFTTKGINEGTGLGLSTVLGIVKSHGGLVNVYSEPNKGTTFKVYLPAIEMPSEARKMQLEQANLPRGNGETILLVDDEPTIIAITTQTLQSFGYRVLTATDGAEAVAAYAEHKNEIAVVLTDMAMPIMDGAATIRALTKINPAIKIIAASGLHANVDATKAWGAGVNHFLTKPYTAGTLLKTLRTILEES